MPKDDDQGLLDLADAVEGLRAELTRAIEKGEEQQARMRFRMREPVVLEVQAVTTRDVSGKVGWKIVELGGSYTAGNTHKITLKLSPEWWDEEQGVYTADFLVSATLPPPLATGATVDGRSSGAPQGDAQLTDEDGDGRRAADDRLDEDDA